MKKTPLILIGLLIILYAIKVFFLDKKSPQLDTPKTQITSSDNTGAGTEPTPNESAPSLDSMPLSPGGSTSSDSNPPQEKPPMPIIDLSSPAGNLQPSAVDAGSAVKNDRGSIAENPLSDKGSPIATDSSGKPKLDKGSHRDGGSYAEPGADLGSSFDNKGKGPDKGSATRADQGSQSVDVGSQAGAAGK